MARDAEVPKPAKPRPSITVGTRNSEVNNLSTIVSEPYSPTFSQPLASARSRRSSTLSGEESEYFCCCVAGLIMCWRRLIDGKPKRAASIHFEVQQRILAKSREKADQRIDISALLFCPNPTRSISSSYRTIEVLGTGAFGSVTRVECLHTGEERAIKQIAKSTCLVDMQYIHTELEAMIKLDHPNIVRCYEFFEDEKRLYLVTEICNAGDFSELDMSNNDEGEVRILFRDIMMAVAYCHDLGIVHRDLKYENCLIDKQKGQRRVGKVIDFGLSAILEDGTDSIALNDQLGTRYFVAPEVIDNRVHYGVKCDCWSIGVMVYICLTDEHPCASDASELSTVDLFRKILSGNIRDAPLMEADVKKDGRDFVYKMLMKDPNDRMGAREALDHNWLQPWRSGKTPKVRSRGTWRSDSILMTRVPTINPKSQEEQLLTRIKSFGKLSRFEKAVMTLVAHHSKSQEVEDLRMIFMKIDASGTGSLTKEEVRKALLEHGKISEADIDEIFDSLDADGTGRIAYTEWLSATMRPDVLASEKAMEHVYNFFDLEQNGVITRSELHKILGDDEAVNSVFAQCRHTDDSPVSKDEFKRLLAELAIRMGAKNAASAHAAVTP